MAEAKFIDDDFDLEEMIEYGEVESRCELCVHYLGEDELTYGERICLAYQKGNTIPDRIWDEDNLHEEVQSDQIGDFLFERK